MPTLFIAALALLGASWLVGVSAAEATRPATLIYSGNLDGELEPCGCAAEGDYGGIRRRATMIKQLRAKNPNLFLIESGGLISSVSMRDRLKSEYIFKGVALLGYDAMGLQWRDLAYGEELALGMKLSWTASNWRSEQGVERQRRVQHGDVTLAFFTWLDPQSAPARKMMGDHLQVTTDPKPVAEAIKDAKQDGALTVLSTTLDLEQAQAQLPLKDIDILIVKSGYEVYEAPRRVGSVVVLQPGSRGMRLGRLDLELDGTGRIKSWHHGVIDLGVKVPDAPELETWYTEYNAKVKEAYLARTAQMEALSAVESPYVGAVECQECHANPYGVWERTLHSKAFARLEEVGKAFDPDCIACHTVAFEKEGGYIDGTLTPHLQNVQCESCHGPSREHVASEGKARTPNFGWAKEQICGQCHTQPHSPTFSIKDYWPGIAH